MGKASSTKKVQRAARAGGRVSSGQPRSLLFPGIIALVLVLGVALVVYARNDRLDEDLGGVPQLDDHIHQAFGVNVCGEWKPNIPEFETKIGLHTHGDGVLHIHPHSDLGVGVNATLGRFMKDAREEGGLDVKISDDKLEYLDEDIEEGKTTCKGVDDPQLLLAYWPDASDASALPEITSGDFNDFRLTDDGAAITIFYGDKDADIPLPPTAANLPALGAADGSGAVPPPDTGSSTTASTAPGETTTTVAGDSTTTTTAG
ncbi:MAG: hypothetical protein ACJ739_10840 [Acidimicrobiales bacterium]